MQDKSHKSNHGTDEAARQEREPVVRIEDLSHLIRSKRWAERLTLEDVARSIGVSAATLSRWERGGVQSRTVRGQSDNGKSIREPDTRTLAALSRWLGVSIDRMVDTESRQGDTGEATPGTVDTLDIVEAHLRADRSLDSQSAELLARLFRVAYEQFSDARSAALKVGNDGEETSTHSEQDTKKNPEDQQSTKPKRSLDEEQENETRR